MNSRKIIYVIFCLGLIFKCYAGEYEGYQAYTSGNGSYIDTNGSTYFCELNGGNLEAPSTLSELSELEIWWELEAGDYLEFKIALSKPIGEIGQHDFADFTALKTIYGDEWDDPGQEFSLNPPDWSLTGALIIDTVETYTLPEHLWASNEVEKAIGTISIVFSNNATGETYTLSNAEISIELIFVHD